MAVIFDSQRASGNAVFSPQPYVAGGATASASITTADSTFAGSASVRPIAAAVVTTAGSVFTGSATAAPALAMMAATAANAVMVGSAVGDIAPVSDLDADRFDYRRALRMPSAYGLDPAIARMGLRMTRRNRW